MTTIKEQIYKHYEEQSSRFSQRIGASSIGKDCARAIWYGFRCADKPQIEGRVLRLFDRGKREEPVVIKDLQNIGYNVFDTDEKGRQFNFYDQDVKGHFGGMMDGCIEIDGLWHVLEIKTMCAKKFKQLSNKGVREIFPEYYVQCQCYMGWSGMTKALFFAVNKDNDEIYTEIVDFNKSDFAVVQSRALNILEANEPPIRISKDPTFFKCKRCDYYSICWQGRFPMVNCRTCCHSSPIVRGQWNCGLKNIPLTKDAQEAACEEHLYIPPLIDLECIEADKDCVVYMTDNQYFINRTATAFPPLNDEYKECEMLTSQELYESTI